MTLKNKIIIDKFLIPIILLIILFFYIIKNGSYMFGDIYGFYIFYFAVWILISGIIINRRTNHLISYSIKEEIIKLKVQSNFKSIQEIDIPINSIKKTEFHTRVFDFGFDILKIKYVDDDELYNLLEIRISEKKEWITLLSKIEK